MSRSRALSIAVLAAASLVLTACGGGAGSEVAQSVASSAASSAPASSSEPAPAESSTAAVTPSDDSSSSEPASGGESTDFCGAFKELDRVGDASSDAEAAEVFRTAAADMKKYAPAEVSKEANAYADALAALADTIDGNAGGISAQQAFAEVLSQSTKEIGVLAVYVGKNC
jgi:predicted small secreted protein